MRCANVAAQLAAVQVVAHVRRPGMLCRLWLTCTGPECCWTHVVHIVVCRLLGLQMRHPLLHCCAMHRSLDIGRVGAVG